MPSPHSQAAPALAAGSDADRFVVDHNPGRVRMGAGALQFLPLEAERLGIRRAFVLTSAGRGDIGATLKDLLGARYAGHFAGAVMHTPVAVTETAIGLCQACQADGIVALGGGSTTGLSKAMALRTDLPQIIVPTTYAGSEVTPILGETRDGVKATQHSARVLPEVVIYDVDLTLALPVSVSMSSGLNALAHAAEALYARDCNPYITLLAERALRALHHSLPLIRAAPRDPAARREALLGAWLSGMCLGSVGMALHHKLCHTVGGAFDLPHAETHGVLLPHALAYTLPAAPEAASRLGQLFGANAALGVYEFARSLGVPASLRELGMPEAGIDRAADLAVQSPYWNPRPVERAGLRSLLARAWRGDPPLNDSLPEMRHA